jgi:ribosomal protein S18 acetylase RimI-like enzyme
MDFRTIDWNRDSESIRRLDTTFVTDRIFAVRRSFLSFALAEVTCVPPYRKRYPISTLEGSVSPPLVRIAAYDNDTLTGFAVVREESWNGRAVITDFFVSLEARRRGIGRGMMNEILSRLSGTNLRVLWVETQNVNLPAVRFYLSIGFELCGLDLTLYPAAASGEVAVYLSKSIGIGMPKQPQVPISPSVTRQAGAGGTPPVAEDQ